MRIRSLNICMSPDEGGGGGPSAPAPAPSAPAPAGTVDVSPSDGGVSDFVADLERSVDARFAARGGKLIDSPSHYEEPSAAPAEKLEPGDRALPVELTGASAPPAVPPAAAPATPPADENPAEKPAEKPAEEQPPAAPAQPQPQLMPTVNINGRTLTAEQVVQMATYYDQRVAEIEQAEKTLTERMESSDSVILRFLAEKPGLREKFLEFASQEHPDLKNTFLETELGKRIGTLEKQWQEKGAAEAQQRQQLEAQQRQQAFQAAAREVEAIALDKAKALEVPPEMVATFGREALAMVNQGHIQFTREAVTKFIIGRLEQQAAWAKSLREKERSAYLDKKKAAPPPPPTGGASPVIQPKSPGFGKELRKLVHQDLANALANIGQ